MGPEWIKVGTVADIPRQGARTVGQAEGPDIGVFRTLDDRIFALVNLCPHKQGPLSQGIVHGHSVSCPLHSFRINLATGEAMGEDKGCTPVVPVKVIEDRIYLGIGLIESVADGGADSPAKAA